ncbi:competence protein CoiA family protein [Herpetosiphon sp. NSE202]|uniref:competence protein CoiA family protein n=1 Tax=Herpetosiphon sp. NSE202 TaxID=3351349 RepID=UPI00364015BD
MHRFQAEPAWVLVNNALAHVREFAYLSPEDRPVAFCPVCNEQVIMKLGQQRVYHYAHKHDSYCDTTKPETALHLNTKFYIAKQLQQSQSILLTEVCQHQCGTTRDTIWLEGWDDVKVEYHTHFVRPDIALLRNNVVIAAIEIVVTHPVSQGKADYLADRKILWIEVAGDRSLYEGKSPWNPSIPLPICNSSTIKNSWICNPCLEQAQLRIDQEAKLRELSEQRLEISKKQWQEQQRRAEWQHANREEIHAGKMVDYYYASGKKYREVYYVIKRYRENRIITVLIKTKQGKTIDKVDGSMDKITLQILNESLKNHIQELKQSPNLLRVDAREWHLWIKGNRFLAKDIRRFPFRYRWNHDKRSWI